MLVEAEVEGTTGSGKPRRLRCGRLEGAAEEAGGWRTAGVVGSVEVSESTAAERCGGSEVLRCGRHRRANRRWWSRMAWSIRGAGEHGLPPWSKCPRRSAGHGDDRPAARWKQPTAQRFANLYKEEAVQDALAEILGTRSPTFMINSQEEGVCGVQRGRALVRWTSSGPS